jgi:4-amino-4-deoxy-L-arabinose transferase-like glycosyltransferase
MEKLRHKLAQVHPRTWLLLAIVVSVVLRVGAALALGDRVVDLPGTNDQISYHTLSLRILNGYGFTFGEPWWPATPAGTPTAHWSFLYTFYLVGNYMLFGVHPLAARLIQATLVGILQPLLAYAIGELVFKRSVGLVAAWLSAVYAYFIYYAAALMTEPFYIITILISLYIAIRYVQNSGKVAPEHSREYLLGALLGFSLGATVLFRQIFLLFLPFLFAWMWCARRHRVGKASILPLALSAVIVLAMVLPFTFYNYTRFHRFVLLNSNAGYAFFFGNHPIYGTKFIPILPDDTGGYVSLIPKELFGMDEAALDQELLRRGLNFVREDPGRYALLSLSRIPVYFMFWPSRDSGMLSNLARVTSFGVLWPFMLYGVVLSLLLRPWSLARLVGAPAFLLQMFLVIYAAIHVFTWALVRYRIPVDAVLIIFASLAFVDLSQRFVAWQRKKSGLPEQPGLV